MIIPQSPFGHNFNPAFYQPAVRAAPPVDDTVPLEDTFFTLPDFETPAKELQFWYEVYKKGDLAEPDLRKKIEELKAIHTPFSIKATSEGIDDQRRVFFLLLEEIESDLNDFSWMHSGDENVIQRHATPCNGGYYYGYTQDSYVFFNRSKSFQGEVRFGICGEGSEPQFEKDRIYAILSVRDFKDEILSRLARIEQDSSLNSYNKFFDIPTSMDSPPFRVWKKQLTSIQWKTQDLQQLLHVIGILFNTFAKVSPSYTQFTHLRDFLLLISPILENMELDEETAGKLLFLDYTISYHRLFSCHSYLGGSLLIKCAKIAPKVFRQLYSDPAQFVEFYCFAYNRLCPLEELLDISEEQALFDCFYRLFDQAVFSKDMNKELSYLTLVHYLRSFPHLWKTHTPTPREHTFWQVVFNAWNSQKVFGYRSKNGEVLSADAPGRVIVENLLRFYLKESGDLTPLEKEILLRQGIALEQPKGASAAETKSLGAIEEQISLLKKMSARLQVEKVKAHACPERANLDVIFECHQIKKRFKGASDPALISVYKEFEAVYDATVSSIPLLSFLRKLSRELRHPLAEPSPALRKFFVVWSQERQFHQSYTGVGTIIQKNLEHARRLFQQQRAKVIQLAAIFFSDPFWQEHPYRSMTIHGTKLSTLHCIVKEQKQERALRATGELVERGIASFAGENCGSMYSRNAHRISFERASQTFEEATWMRCAGKDCSVMMFDTPTNYLQSVLFAIRQVNPFALRRPDFIFSLSALQKEIDALCQIDDASSFTKCDMAIISGHHLNILRFRMTHPDAERVLAPLKKKIDDYIATTKNVPDNIQRIHNALTVAIPFQFSAEDLVHMQDKTPIVFATFSAFDPETGIWNREVTLPSPLFLGPDIPVVFTFEESLQTVLAVSGDTPIQVRPMEELLLAEMLNMIEGSHVQEDRKMEDVQARISSSIKHFALPHYAKPFPRTVHFSSRASFERIEDECVLSSPLFGKSFKDADEYLQEMALPRRPARSTHGTMHMLRASLFCQIMQTILSNKLQKPLSPSERYLITMAAAFHDSARQDEGVDRWDAASAWNFREFLLKLDLPPNELKIYFDAIAKKDEVSETKTMAQMAVHDADCIEILRCIRDVNRFRKERLAIKEALPAEELDAFIREALAFILETETMETKVHFEFDAEDPYQELVALFNKGPYPTLQKYFPGYVEQPGVAPAV